MDNNKKYLGTFEGVFTPTILTILGVIMYLRLGWIVGNAGLIGSILIIIFAHVITICTTLSMSSILTNIKIGAGGAYAIISRSLGLEVGGAIGIPLYLSQAISVAFYITGFSELLTIFNFPISQKFVSIITWLILSIVSILSTKLAFRIQYFILAFVFLSIVSFLLGHPTNDSGITIWGSFQEAGFWDTFAVFSRRLQEF
jgi:amino acid permease